MTRFACRRRTALPRPAAFRRYGLAVLVTFWGGVAQADTLEHVATFEWPGDSVVGLSGLEVSDDGRSFMTVSDRGWFLSGTFERQEGAITGVTLQDYLPVLGNDGLPVAGRRIGDWSDAEGLALAPDGTYWISFERWAHVSRYEAPRLGGQFIRDHPDFYTFAENRQLEALAIHPDRTLYTFPEKPLRAGFPVFALVGDTWEQRGHIAAQDRFSIVGADFDADGTLYLLERKLVLGLWWQNRVRRLQIDAPETVEVLWTGDRGAFYNLEGLAVWYDDAGLRLTAVSDNNGDPSEPTQFVDFRLVRDD